LSRKSEVKRSTTETNINIELNLDGTDRYKIDTPIGFFNHMLELLAKHALFDLNITASGDVEVDSHHLIEDVGICLGQAIKNALGDRAGIRRYGFFIMPMDESLCRIAVDIGGRPYLVYKMRVAKEARKEIDLYKNFFTALATSLGANIHITVLYGDDPHHCIESIFKALGRALRQAVSFDEREKGVPSSKGRID
jgi:imidazoleglycerol-phosphate dehydratase